uniref:Uncharacterized protein n=1 Tax=Knipowitschia caucasica TaxID=637954 RepID=A0AAV2M611_KNICA
MVGFMVDPQVNIFLRVSWAEHGHKTLSCASAAALWLTQARPVGVFKRIHLLWFPAPSPPGPAERSSEERTSLAESRLHAARLDAPLCSTLLYSALTGTYSAAHVPGDADLFRAGVCHLTADRVDSTFSQTTTDYRLSPQTLSDPALCPTMYVSSLWIVHTFLALSHLAAGNIIAPPAVAHDPLAAPRVFITFKGTLP